MRSPAAAAGGRSPLLVGFMMNSTTKPGGRGGNCEILLPARGASGPPHAPRRPGRGRPAVTRRRERPSGQAAAVVGRGLASRFAEGGGERARLAEADLE